jgi:hypothetical protein
MNQQQNQLASDEANISPFLEYVDSIINELLEAKAAIRPAQTDLAVCISSIQRLQEFVQQCLSIKPSLRLDVLHAVTKIDSEIYADLLHPALQRRIKTSILT